MRKQKSIGENVLLIRRVRADDCEDVWRWRNDPLVRRFSFSQAEIPLLSHRVWFEEKIRNKNTVMFIFEDDQGAKVGQVRFEIMRDNTALISVNMNPQYMGQGFGTYVIVEATRTLIKENPMIVSVQAEVLEDNVVSQKVFQKAGYLLEGQKIRDGKGFFVFIRLGRKSDGN